MLCLTKIRLLAKNYQRTGLKTILRRDLSSSELAAGPGMGFNGPIIALAKIYFCPGLLNDFIVLLLFLKIRGNINEVPLPLYYKKAVLLSPLHVGSQKWQFPPPFCVTHLLTSPSSLLVFKW